jgi:Lrp/AsnC family leucine-responsive transcriptional regulator
MKLDTLHSQILEQLQRNARISNTAIAHQVGISSPAVTERIKKLEDAGIIDGYYAKVSHFELGYDFRALITVRAFMGRLQPFLHKVKTLDEVINCYRKYCDGSGASKSTSPRKIDRSTDHLRRN